MSEEKIQENQNINKLAEIEKKCEEYLNNWKRAVADMSNYKKDEVARAGMLIKYAKEDVILNILPVLDSINLAESHIPEEIRSNNWSQGFMQIKKQIEDFLKKEGIEEIKTMGDPSAGSGQVKFDPVFMEAVEQVEGEESGIVAEELQKGYLIEGKLLRVAQVKVSK